MDKAQLSQAILDLLAEHEAEQTRELQAALGRMQALESELAHLRSQLAKPNNISEQLRDEELRQRLLAVANAPFDTRLREAGVVLENRIRKLISPAGAGETGGKLVDLAFLPEKGQFQASTVTSEQLGLHSLYKGAIQFIRNPPMHKLIEYPEQTAYTLLTMIDALLILLTEVTTQTASARNASRAPMTRWTPDMVRTAYRSHANATVGSRLERILDLSLQHQAFRPSRGVSPVFGIKSKRGKRMISFYVDGGMYFSLLPDSYPSEDERLRVFKVYQGFRMLESYAVLNDVKEGRYSGRPLGDLTDDEFDLFMKFLVDETS
jgi:hypothetical protein